MTIQKQVCDLVERVLADHRGSMHVNDLAPLVNASLSQPITPQRITGILHDDSSGRFVKIGRAIWDLAARKPVGR